MPPLQCFSNQPLIVSAGQSHIQINKTQNRFSKIKSDALSSKQEGSFNTSKISQETHSFANQTQATAGVAKKRLTLSVNGLSTSWLINAEAFADYSKVLPVSKAAEIKPFFPNQNIENSSHELLIPLNVMQMELDDDDNEDSGLATLNSSSNVVERHQDPAANEHDVITGDLLKQELNQFKNRCREQRRQDKLKMNSDKKKQSVEKRKARYEQLKKMRQENPLEAEKFKQQMHLYKQKHLDKVKADPELLKKHKQKDKEYKQKYLKKLKSDPAKKEKAEELKKRTSQNQKKHLEKTKTNPELLKKRKQKKQEYHQKYLQSLETDPQKKARFVEKNKLYCKTYRKKKKTTEL